MPTRFRVGDRVRAIACIPYGLDTMIELDEEGIVVARHAAGLLEEGIDVLWDKSHQGLAWWGNTTLFVVGDDHLNLVLVRPITIGETQRRHRVELMRKLARAMGLIGTCSLLMVPNVASSCHKGTIAYAQFDTNAQEAINCEE